MGKFKSYFVWPSLSKWLALIPQLIYELDCQENYNWQGGCVTTAIYIGQVDWWAKYYIPPTVFLSFHPVPQEAGVRFEGETNITWCLWFKFKKLYRLSTCYSHLQLKSKCSLMLLWKLYSNNALLQSGGHTAHQKSVCRNPNVSDTRQRCNSVNEFKQVAGCWVALGNLVGWENMTVRSNLFRTVGKARLANDIKTAPWERRKRGMNSLVCLKTPASLSLQAAVSRWGTAVALGHSSIT